MGQLDKVQKILDKMHDDKPIGEVMADRQERLKKLAFKHSVQCTALAAGLTMSTLTQYLRVKHPVTIGEQCVRQAEYVLSQL